MATSTAGRTRAARVVRLAAPFARLLYAETEASQARRAREAELRAAGDHDHGGDRPNKLQRRLIHKFKRSLGRG